VEEIENQDDRVPDLYDAIAIGSGFGGSMIASQLVQAGLKVLILERGDWVNRGPHNWAGDGSLELTPYSTTETPYRVLAGGTSEMMGTTSCVGGPSVFYGTVSLRFREADFAANPEIVGDSGARWPFNYSDLEPYYTRAEQILNIAGETGSDPTEPYRSSPYCQKPHELAHPSKLIAEASRELGFQPFRLPVAINYSSSQDRNACIACNTCDSFACAIGAKNDLATCVLPASIQKGLVLKTNTVATRLVREEKQIVAVDCFDKQTNQPCRYYAKLFILAAGALASPHILLTSDLQHSNPGGHTIGHYLMRHCNGIVFGLFPGDPNPAKQFHKQIGIQDFYFGHPTIKNPSGKLGNLQQLETPPQSLVEAYLPQPVGRLLSPLAQRLTGLQVIAEDQPQYDNHVIIDHSKVDRFGLPQLLITHHHTQRDEAARKALIKKAKAILRKAGAFFFYVHQIKTFSHAVGTVRMGEDPHNSALDPNCRFRGIDNLYVVDGSFMPTSAGVNPSLTIAANALRVGEQILKR
jgi:choline dehydrogenase-like flavoprotein